MNEITEKFCRNCNTQLQLKYCPQCGQKDREFQPRIKEFFQAVWDDFVSIDAKLINTLKVLFQPGRYAADWIEGKQQRYVHPVRLYIFLSVLYSILTFLGLESATFLNGFITGFLDAGHENSKITQYLPQILQLVAFSLIPILIITAKLYDIKSRMVTSIFFVVTLYSVITLLSMLQLFIEHFAPGGIIEQILASIVAVIGFIFILFSAQTVYKLNFIHAFFKTITWIFLNLLLIISIGLIAEGFFEAHSDAISTERIID